MEKEISIKTKNKTFSEICEKIKEFISKRPRIFLLISGILTGLTLVFPVLGFLEWITLIPAGIAVFLRVSDRNVRLRSLYLDGFVLFYSFYATCFHWFIALYPLEFIPGMTKFGAIVVVILGWLGLSLLQALLSGFALVFAGVILRGRVCEQTVWLKPIALASLWTLAEWFQTVGWWGVPWARLAIGQTFYLFGLQNASWFGTYFITFVVALANFLIAFAVINPPKIKIGVIAVLTLILFQYGSGALIWCLNDVQSGDKVRIACVQGNVSSSQGWGEESFKNSLENYSKYTKEAADNGAEIVVWSETAFPYKIDAQSSFANMAKENGVYLFVGVYTGGDDELLNSLVCFTPEGKMHETVYSKRHLVPFGEYTPLRSFIETFIPPLADLMLTATEIDPGEGSKIIKLDNGIDVGSLICFDSIYEELTLETARDGAEIICLSTNDSWFSDSRALYMHNAQAQIRAVESGKYIARSANTGISTIINSRGEVIESLEPLVGGTIVCDVYANDNQTLWTSIGNVFIYTVMSGFFAIILWETVLKIKKKT